MITLKIDYKDWRKVEEYLLHQGAWYTGGERVFYVEGKHCRIVHIEKRHAVYLMMKYSVEDFTANYEDLLKYKLDYYY